MVYVLDIDGNPIMPTRRHGHVRRLLREKKAHVVKRCPFTIRLDYETEGETQPVSLGVDAGSKTVGLSATTEKDVLFESEVMLRNDIVNLLSTRRECRRARRSRKTRYRKARFDNRRKPRGWLAPSVRNKIDTHLSVIRKVREILPVSRIVVETASFDIQKIKALSSGKNAPQGKDYQQGDRLGFWNVREYVLFRDGHACQCCKGRSEDSILNVHHIESRKTGGNYGYITKNTRIRNGLPKEHRVDARCISGNLTATPPDEYFLQRKVRRHNRQLHKMTIGKGGKRRNNQAPKYVHGFQLFDKVRCGKAECFVFGRRMRGCFSVRLADGTVVSSDVSCKRLNLLERRKTILVERRGAAFLHA